MSVLVTGGAGYIGSHVVLALRDAHHDVVVLDDLSTGHANAVPADVTLYVADVGEQSKVGDVMRRHRVDSVIHLAALTVVPASVLNPLACYDVNVSRMRTLLEATVAAGVRRFVFSSSAAVYGEVGAKPVAEEATTRPLSPYGRSKLVGEWMLADAAVAHGLQGVALRYFNVAGADPKGRAGQSTPEATHLVKVAVEAAIGLRDGVDIYGEDHETPYGTGVRDYVHVSDVASAHVAALDYLASGRGSLTCNCGYGRGSSVREVLGAVAEAAGTQFPVRVAPARPGDAASVVAATGRIRRVLEWEPRHEALADMVRHALAWERRLLETAVDPRRRA